MGNKRVEGDPEKVKHCPIINDAKHFAAFLLPWHQSQCGFFPPYGPSQQATVIIAQGQVSLAASWTTAVEYAMDNKLSGRGMLKLYLIQALVFLSKVFTRVGSTICIAGCIDGDICVLRLYMKKSHVIL